MRRRSELRSSLLRRSLLSLPPSWLVAARNLVRRNLVRRSPVRDSLVRENFVRDSLVCRSLVCQSVLLRQIRQRGNVVLQLRVRVRQCDHLGLKVPHGALQFLAAPLQLLVRALQLRQPPCQGLGMVSGLVGLRLELGVDRLELGVDRLEDFLVELPKLFAVARSFLH